MKKLVLAVAFVLIALLGFSVQPVQAQGNVIYIPMVYPKRLHPVEGGPVFGELDATLVVNAGTTSYCAYPWTPVAAGEQQVCVISGIYIGPLTAESTFGLPVMQDGSIQLWGGNEDGVNPISPEELPTVEVLVMELPDADDFGFPDGPIADLVPLGGYTVPFIDVASVTQPSPSPIDILRYADALRKFIVAFIERNSKLPGIKIPSDVSFSNFRMTSSRIPKPLCTAADEVGVIFTGATSITAGGVVLAEVQFTDPVVHACMTVGTHLSWYIYYPVGLLMKNPVWLAEHDTEVRTYLAVAENTYSFIPRWLGELPTPPEGTEWVFTALASGKVIHYLLGFGNAAKGMVSVVSGFILVVVPDEFLCGIQHGLPEGTCWQNPPPQSNSN